MNMFRDLLGLCQSNNGSIARGHEPIFCGDDYAAKLRHSVSAAARLRLYSLRVRR